MATSTEFLDFVLEQLQGIGVLRYRRLFGEAMVYLNDRPVMLVCNDTVFVKEHPAIANLMRGAEIGIPYDGAKEHYILDIDNADFSKQVILELEKVTPLPKSRKKKSMNCNELPKRLDRKTIYESDFVCLYVDKVKMFDGHIIEKYHQIHYPHKAVCIVLFNENDEVLLIQSRRYTTMRLEWEIPAGRIEAGETKEDAARRECMEETGCTVKDLKFLCVQNPTNGMSDHECYIFAAKVDVESMNFDENEVKAKKWVSRNAVLEMLKNNKTRDGISIAALLFAFEFYK